MFPEVDLCTKRLLLICLMGVSGVPAFGRQVLHSFDGERIGARFGHAVSGAMDVNADGFVDLIVGAPSEWRGSLSHAGSATVYSGQDGSVLHRFEGSDRREMRGFSVSGLGDVDADGHADLVVSSGGSYVHVRSGRTGALLYTLWFWGAVLDVVGDVDNDGFPDLVAGRSASGSSRVDLFSGRDGSWLYNVPDTVPGGGFGETVAGVGDVNLDGSMDFAIGSSQPFGGGPGVVQIYSGPDGSLLSQILGDDQGDYLGRAVSAAGDANGDGYADLLIGAPGDDGAGDGAGQARVYSGQDGSVLLELNGQTAGAGLGAAVDLAGDVDGDGSSDLIVGAPGEDHGGVVKGGMVVFSGASGLPLMSQPGAYPDSQLGSSVSALGDLNMDGLADVIVGAPGRGANGSDAGGVQVLSGRCGAVSAFGESCVGTGGHFPRLEVTSPADCFSLGSAVRIEISGGLGGPGVAAGLLIGFAEGSWTLPSGCALSVDLSGTLLLPLGELTGIGNGNGSLSVSTPILNLPGTLYLQALIDDSFQGLIATNGVRLTLRP